MRAGAGNSSWRQRLGSSYAFTDAPYPQEEGHWWQNRGEGSDSPERLLQDSARAWKRQISEAEPALWYHPFRSTEAAVLGGAAYSRGANAHLQLVTALLPPCWVACSEHPPARCTGELGLPEDHKAASSAPASTAGNRALPAAPVQCWPLGLLFLGALEFA